MKNWYTLILVCSVFMPLQAQIGIGTTTPNAILDIKATNQAVPQNTDGILIPKIDVFPTPAPTALQQGMLVYLTTTVGTNPPGFYYWNNPTVSWIGFGGPSVGNSLDQAYDSGGAGLGRTITADAGAVLINGTDGLVSTGTLSSGALAPTGTGIRMLWNPRKAAFRAGYTVGTQWEDANIGLYSVAFGNETIASGNYSTAFGLEAVASGDLATAFGETTTASGIESTAFGFGTEASGETATAFGAGTEASGNVATAFGDRTTAIGNASTAFGHRNTAPSFGETVLGIGATTYTPSANGATQFRAANGTDRLLVVGNAIDANNNNGADTAERHNALTILKNGNTGLGTDTPTETLHVVGKIRMVDGNEGLGKILVSDANGTATWETSAVTLDQAYDSGGAGLGRTIVSDAGAVTINGTDGIVSTGTAGSGALAPTGAGVKMYWNPRRAAFRSGQVQGTEWDDVNVGLNSTAFGINTTASGKNSLAFGSRTIADGNPTDINTIANGDNTTAFGQATYAIGHQSTAFGYWTDAIGDNSTTFGYTTTATGNSSTAFGKTNQSHSFAETVLGIGATDYVPSLNGESRWRTSNATDRLFVVGNALDLNTNGSVEFAERSNALTILKNGRTALGNVTPLGQLELSFDQGRKPGTSVWTIVSDQRLKTVNGVYTKGLNEILQLKPIRYHYKNIGDRVFEKEVLDTEYSGFLAQEVQPLFPEAVGVDDDGYLNFNMHSILIATINAIKELKAENDTLKAEAQTQNQLLIDLLNRVETLEKRN